MSGLPATAGNSGLRVPGGVWAGVSGEHEGRLAHASLSACGTSALGRPFHHIRSLSHSFGCVAEGQSDPAEEGGRPARLFPIAGL